MWTITKNVLNNLQCYLHSNQKKCRCHWGVGQTTLQCYICSNWKKQWDGCSNTLEHLLTPCIVIICSCFGSTKYHILIQVQALSFLITYIMRGYQKLGNNCSKMVSRPLPEVSARVLLLLSTILEIKF